MPVDHKLLIKGVLEYHFRPLGSQYASIYFFEVEEYWDDGVEKGAFAIP